MISVESQQIRGALSTGLNLSQVDGDEVYGYHKFGFNAGVAALIPLSENKKFYLSLENMFNQKGAFAKHSIDDDTTAFYYKLILNYVEIPVLFHYEDRESITIGAGASYAYLTGLKEYERSVRTAVRLGDGTYNRSDYNAIVDLRFRLYKNLKANIRYSYSVFKLRTRHFSKNNQNWERKQYNNMISLRIIWVFNEYNDNENK